MPHIFDRHNNHIIMIYDICCHDGARNHELALSATTN